MEVQLKLRANELQTLGQMVSKRSKMSERNIFLPDILHQSVCVSVCQGNEMFRLFFEVGLFNLAEKTRCSYHQWHIQVIQVPYHNKPELNRIFPESVTRHAWLRWTFIQCRHVCFRGAWLLCLARLLLHFEYSSSGQFLFADVIFVGSKLPTWLAWTKELRSAQCCPSQHSGQQTSAPAGHFQCLCLHCERDLFEQAETNVEPSGYLPIIWISLQPHQEWACCRLLNYSHS